MYKKLFTKIRYLKLVLPGVILMLCAAKPLYANAPYSDKYVQLKWVADSLYHAKDYRNAKTVYLNILKCKHYQRNDLYWLFSCCEHLHQKDSAFHFFSIAVNEGLGWDSISTPLKDVYISGFLLKDTTLFAKLRHNINLLNNGDTAYWQLRKQLLDRQVMDQKYRLEIADYEKDSKGSKKVIDSLWKLQIKIDSDNTAFLKKITHTIGWPGIDKVGIDGDQAAWLIVQHADHDVKFQQFCLSLLAKEMAKHNTVVTNYPYLQDRILINNGQAQIFGTQFQSGSTGANLELRPIRDEKEVEKLRNAYSLGSLDTYKKYAKNHYGINTNDNEK